MDENNVCSSSLPPFLTKTYEMVEDSSSDSIVSWSDNNKSFIVKNQMEFSQYLLPRFFKHKNFSSFIRQLNTYGFRKIDAEKWEFANDDFVRGRPHRMKNIHRRKPVHSHSLQPQNPLKESERQSMNDQIDRLRKEKEGLLAELQNQEQELKGYEMQTTTLNDRIQHMEQRQLSILSYVSEVLENPGLSLNLETHSKRKRRFLETGVQEKTIVNPQSLSHAEQVEKLETSLTFWENVVTESCDKSSGMQASSMDLDAAESSLSMGDNRPKSSRIDMNSEPVTVAASKTGVNDVFWEQLLTENGSIEQHEVNLERKDTRKFWWHSQEW